MIQLIGIKSCCPIEIREQLSIAPSKEKIILKSMLKIAKEAVIINTCNRTEIYVNFSEDKEIKIEEIFMLLNWNKEYIKYIFTSQDYEVVKHLMEVCSGFHSRILGEDQILGQVKKAYKMALECNTIGNYLQRLFQMAVACGKEFRYKAKLYKIPVSSASIAAKEIIRENKKKIMLLGFGEVGKRIYKYLSSFSFTDLYLVVRDPDKIVLNDSRVKIISYDEKSQFIKDVEVIISCTSAPHLIIYKEEVENHPLIIFDLSLPRDVDPEIEKLEYIKLYHIDDIGKMDKYNRQKRKVEMERNRYIIEKYIREFLQWESLRDLAPLFGEMSKHSEHIHSLRFESYNRKKYTKDNKALVKTMIKSTADYYLHRAMEVLKEEKLKGSEKQCQEIIERIFLKKD